jgi:hypothetical protein
MSSYSNNNPYQGFDTPYVPGYNQPFNQCGCGGPDACGNEHQAAVKVENVTRVTATGKRENVTRVVPLGHIYDTVVHKAFATWDGKLALNDLYKPHSRTYRPPALPYVCDRPMAGSSLCSAQGGGSGQCGP